MYGLIGIVYFSTSEGFYVVIAPVCTLNVLHFYWFIQIFACICNFTVHPYPCAVLVKMCKVVHAKGLFGGSVPGATIKLSSLLLRWYVVERVKALLSHPVRSLETWFWLEPICYSFVQNLKLAIVHNIQSYNEWILVGQWQKYSKI